MYDISEIARVARALHIRTRTSILGKAAGPYRSSWSGSGYEFRQLRGYVAGDDIRYVDWKSTARTGNLLVRDYYDEHNRVFLIVMDQSASMQFTSGTMSKLDIASRIAATLSYTGYMYRDAVGYIGCLDHVHTHIPPQSGGKHIRTIMRHIASDAQYARGGMNISDMLHHVVARYKRPVGLILLSDFIDTTYEQMLRYAAYRHAVIPIRVLDPQEAALEAPDDVCMYDPETHAQYVTGGNMHTLYQQWFAEYDAHFHRVMRKYGITPHTFYTDRDWATHIQTCFHR